MIMLWLNYKDWKFIVLLRINGTFISNVLGKIWRQNRKKRGGDVDFIHKNNLRREFTYVVVMGSYSTNCECLRVLAWFLEKDLRLSKFTWQRRCVATI